MEKKRVILHFSALKGIYWYHMTSTAKTILGLVVAVAIIGAGYYVYTNKSTAKQSAFTINGETVTLVNGTYEKESAPGSASKTTTTYFGNETKGDFNNDGTTDSAFLVTQSTGGSGTFFYLATTLGGEAVLLGDRISPQSTEYMDGKIVVNYADRKAGEPMTTQPSVGVSKYFEVKGGALIETQKDSTTTPSTSNGKKIAFSELVKQNGTYKCSVNQTVGNVTTSGTVYMDKGMVRGEFAAEYSGQKANITFLMRDGFTYVWNSMMPTQGFKLKSDATVDVTGAKAQATGEIHASANTYLEQIGDYNCEAWTVDESKFVIPTTVTFSAMN